ncbi:hypothetical protein [Clostridium mediterraneense]|uniref:hypothetical protein n=1 Tax=Clostridium mediterraneense TaxID=1805472 RepID=UPI00082D3978|nr:hypothetical protein [Clostridium mediterraneense]
MRKIAILLLSISTIIFLGSCGTKANEEFINSEVDIKDTDEIIVNKKSDIKDKLNKVKKNEDSDLEKIDGYYVYEFKDEYKNIIKIKKLENNKLEVDFKLIEKIDSSFGLISNLENGNMRVGTLSKVSEDTWAGVLRNNNFKREWTVEIKIENDRLVYYEKQFTDLSELPIVSSRLENKIIFEKSKIEEARQFLYSQFDEEEYYSQRKFKFNEEKNYLDEEMISKDYYIFDLLTGLGDNEFLADFSVLVDKDITEAYIYHGLDLMTVKEYREKIDDK